MMVSLWMWISLSGCFGPVSGAASAAVAPTPGSAFVVAIDTGDDTGTETSPSE